MSKTDKTNPWLVRVAQHHPSAEHDHRAGICDLPATPLDESGLWSERYCHWGPRFPWAWSCCSGCGCRLCTGFYGRLWERRSSRHQATRTLRGLLKAFRASDTDDVEDAGEVQWWLNRSDETRRVACRY